MWSYIRRCKKQNIAAFAVLFLVNAGWICNQLIDVAMMDQALAGNLKNTLLILAGCFLMNLLVVFLKYEQKRTVAGAIKAMNCEMRKDLNEKIIRRNYEKFLEKDTGEYISWYMNDVKEAETRGFQNFFEYVNCTLLFLMNVIFLLVISWQLLVMSLLVAAASFYVSQYFEKQLEEKSANVSVAMERFTEKVKEQIAGIRVLKSFGHLKKFDQDMSREGKRMEDERVQFARESAKVGRRIHAVSAIGMHSVHVLLFLMTTVGKIPVPVLGAGVNVISQIYSTFERLISMRVNLVSARPYFQKIAEEESEEERSREKESVKKQMIKKEITKTEIAKKEESMQEQKPAPLPAIQKDIQLRDLRFCYTDHPVLRGVSLDFKIGGKYVLVGKSGCGKSTLLKLLLGQLTGYQGEILFDGKEAAQYDRDSFYQQMAYIEQNVFLFHDTIRENITMGDSFTEAELEEALQKSALLGDLDHFADGLDTDVGENGSHLSGGQKQRVAIARALIHHRSILIVDEGTSALDQENAAMIEDTLLACQDLTVIMVSHHLREEKKKAYTAVYRLENGIQA